MSNDIPARQNTVDYVNMVRASRYVYGLAKTIGGFQLALTMLSALGGPAAAAIVSHYSPAHAPVAKAWAGLFALGAILIDLVFLEPLGKRLQETGARIQEQFDTRLYDLPWNQVKVGDPVDAGALASNARKHRAKRPDDKPFQDWYPAVVGRVPMSHARLICQGSSMRWDSSLRRNFCLIYLGALVLILLSAFSYALAAGYDMQAMVLSVFMPLLPAALQLWREYKKHAEAGADTERACAHLNGLWAQLLEGKISEDDVKHQSRLLQDELFDRRRRAPAIPERLYQFTREEYEEKMKHVAEEKVEQAEQKMSKPAPAAATT